MIAYTRPSVHTVPLPMSTTPTHVDSVFVLMKIRLLADHAFMFRHNASPRDRALALLRKAQKPAGAFPPCRG